LGIPPEVVGVEQVGWVELSTHCILKASVHFSAL